MSVLKDLDSCTYSTLPKNVRSIFEEYKIKMIIYTLENGIEFQSKDIERIKRDLFRKYNYGMTALNKSEVARAKYLYDELTIQIREYFLNNENHYKNCVSLFLPISKRDYNDREKMNLLLMNVRELLSIPYIPIIGVKAVTFGNAVIENYYDTFVKKNNPTDTVKEFIKIAEKIFAIKEKLKESNNPLRENILFFKSVYWMLSLLYKVYPEEFYNFQINRFCHYIESQDNALDYFNNYKNLNSNHIINRHIYVKRYISQELELDIESYLESIIDNRKKVVYKAEKKLKSDENWSGISNNKQIITMDDTFTVNEIIKFINQNRFIVRPVYQRSEVRSLEKASKIIESILLGVKLPPIYVIVKKNQDSLNTFTVIDGQQRLISILRYMGEQITDENYNFINTYKKDYTLTGLKDLNYLNGKKYEGKEELNEEYKKIIQKYELDFIKIDEQFNPNFDPVDMFLRLNENPCTIGKNTFEMWNSFDIVNTIETIKEVAKYDLFKQSGNSMKEEELVTILAYMEKEKVNISNCNNFFRIHLYTENRDKINERTEVKLSINNKEIITHFLETLEPDSKEELEFLECVNRVKLFISKLKLLSDDDPNKLITIFNPYLNVARKGNMKDFYMMWLILQPLDNHIIKTYKTELLFELEEIFKLMKKMPKNKDVDFFMDRVTSIVNNYKKYTVEV